MRERIVPLHGRYFNLDHDYRISRCCDRRMTNHAGWLIPLDEMKDCSANHRLMSMADEYVPSLRNKQFSLKASAP